MINTGAILLRGPIRQETQDDAVPDHSNEQQVLQEIVEYGRLSIRANTTSHTDNNVRPTPTAGALEHSGDVSLHADQPQPTDVSASKDIHPHQQAERVGAADQRSSVSSGERSSEPRRQMGLSSFVAEGDTRALTAVRQSRPPTASSGNNVSVSSNQNRRNTECRNNPCKICGARPATTVFCRQCNCFVSCQDCALNQPPTTCPRCLAELVPRIFH
ncbi:hypothetical protein V1264_015765 [Littorina saxatilis]|uniref:Uncharacterized protein n=1 Tax=Littorina saxatilis TaxID=31220 RepID=A0AAN9BMH5_9CAEN